MEILADAMPDKAAIPRSTDGMVDIQSLLRLLAEQVVMPVRAFERLRGTDLHACF